MTDLKTLDARIAKMQAQLQRLQNRRSRTAAKELKSAERQRLADDSRRRALAGDLLLDAVNRGVLDPGTVAAWCETLEIDRDERDLLGV